VGFLFFAANFSRKNFAGKKFLERGKIFGARRQSERAEKGDSHDHLDEIATHSQPSGFFIFRRDFFHKNFAGKIFRSAEKFAARRKRGQT